jgi:hypothetical protein
MLVLGLVSLLSVQKVQHFYSHSPPHRSLCGFLRVLLVFTIPYILPGGIRPVRLDTVTSLAIRFFRHWDDGVRAILRQSAE